MRIPTPPLARLFVPTLHVVEPLLAEGDPLHVPEEDLAGARRPRRDAQRIPHRVGANAPGRYADLVAVTGAPLRGITELERGTRVMKGGVVAKDLASR